MKVCARCHEEKEDSCFPLRSDGGLHSYCRDCKKAYMEERRGTYVETQYATFRERYRTDEAFREAHKESRRVEYRKYAAAKKDDSRRRRARIRNVRVERVSFGKVAERDGYRCGICKGPVDMGLKRPDLDSPSLDHIVPLIAGGPHSYENVQLAHLRCNLQKGKTVISA